MLAKFKKIKNYINHGIWFYPEKFDYPIKRKILHVRINFSQEKWIVENVFVQQYGWIDSDKVYMTKKEAIRVRESVMLSRFKQQRYGIKEEIRNLENKIGWIERDLNRARNQLLIEHKRLEDLDGIISRV